MPNTYFQFKQFTIHQDQCAMKVSTEACIFGAWVPDTKPTRVLDIGTGTGLLGLMLAQRIGAPIDAVELDAKAVDQARRNIMDSPWPDRITMIEGNIFEYAKNTSHSYDLILSNPPFFTNSLKSKVNQKNLAKHDSAEFNKASLAKVLKTLLSETGKAYILYPELETHQFKVEAENQGLHWSPGLIIRNQPNGSVFRIISEVSTTPSSQESEELHIREGGKHTEEFNKLLSPYYLKL